MAELIFYYGTMDCGKTAKLLTTQYNYDFKNIKNIIIKPSVDIRDIKVKSRIGIEKECLRIDETVNIYDVIFNYYIENNDLKVIFVDEAQFLKETQVNQLTKIVDNMDINIYCYGLKSNFQSKLFEGSKRLFELADKVEELWTVCDCGNKATMVERLDNNGQPIFIGKEVVCGGNDMYISKCRECYMRDYEEYLNTNN